MKPSANINGNNNRVDCSIICPEHGPLVDLKQHCDRLVQFLVQKDFEEEIYNPIADWFRLASGITGVTYIEGLFDYSSDLCEPVLDYQEAASNFNSKVILELTRFTFIYSGFEALVDSLDLSDCPHKRQRGMANKVNHYIKTKYEDGQITIIPYYPEVVSVLKQMLMINPWHGSVNELFAVNKCANVDLVGLKAICEIRNLFAHGSFRFSKPDEWNETKPYDAQIIATSSRIILMTIQMLIGAFYEKKDFSITDYYGMFDFKESQANDFLLKMHLKILE